MKEYLLIGLILISGCFLDEEIMAAVKAGDPDMCKDLDDKSGTRVDKCLNAVAREVGDHSICKDISENSKADLCIADVARKKLDPAICRDITDPADKDPCLTFIAEKKDDVTLCDEVGDEGRQAGCIKTIAVNRVDASLCDGIADSEKRERNDCYVDIVWKNGDSELCTGLTERRYKDDCYYAAAIKNKDLPTCSMLEDETEKERCVAAMAGILGDPHLCDGLEKIGKFALQNCYTDAAETAGDPDICKRIDDSDSKNGCYIKLAWKLDQPGLCENLQRVNDHSVPPRDQCYSDFAAQGRPELCEKVADENQKQLCMQRANQ